MKTKDIQKLIGKYCILKGHSPVAENIKYLDFGWEGDLISMTKSGYLWEYEVKVSMNDFYADAKKIDKHYAYKLGREKNSPNYFSYVCPDKLIPVNKIPEYAGLFYMIENEIKEIKSPKLLHKLKHDKMSIMEKCLRVYCERHFLGSCLLTYLNKEKVKEWEKWQQEVIPN